MQDFEQAQKSRGCLYDSEAQKDMCRMLYGFLKVKFQEAEKMQKDKKPQRSSYQYQTRYKIREDKAEVDQSYLKSKIN